MFIPLRLSSELIPGYASQKLYKHFFYMRNKLFLYTKLGEIIYINFHPDKNRLLGTGKTKYFLEITEISIKKCW